MVGGLENQTQTLSLTRVSHVLLPLTRRGSLLNHPGYCQANGSKTLRRGLDRRLPPPTMDLYRLRYPPYLGCVSEELVEDLIKCSEPQEGTEIPLLQSPFGVIEGRLETMFFSQQQIHDTFGTSTMAERILRCGCKGCDDHRSDQTVNDTQYIEAITTKQGSLLVAVLVYLGKMHLLYPLIDGFATDTSKARPLDIMEKKGDSWFRDGQKEREIFSGAWKRALPMFYPLKFDVKSHSDSARPSVRPFYKYEDSDRFPYWDYDYEFEPGAFGRMQKFQVPTEYLEPGAMAILDSYPGSTEGTGRTKKVNEIHRFNKSIYESLGMGITDR